MLVAVVSVVCQTLFLTTGNLSSSEHLFFNLRGGTPDPDLPCLDPALLAETVACRDTQPTDSGRRSPHVDPDGLWTEVTGNPR